VRILGKKTGGASAGLRALAYGPPLNGRLNEKSPISPAAAAIGSAVDKKAAIL